MKNRDKILEMIQRLDAMRAAPSREGDEVFSAMIHIDTVIADTLAIDVSDYCTSRDSVASIRPEGWRLYLDDWRDKFGQIEGVRYVATLSRTTDSPDPQKWVKSKPMHSEILAELHATIQAIDLDMERRSPCARQQTDTMS